MEGRVMDQEEALAGDYVGVMLVAIAMWIALVVAGVMAGGYFALTRL
jgi:hypothetical protein